MARKPLRPAPVPAGANSKDPAPPPPKADAPTPAAITKASAPPAAPVVTKPSPAAATLSIEDVRAIRERLDITGTAPVATGVPASTADQLVLLVSDKLAEARKTDTARIATLEEGLAKARAVQADSDAAALGLSPALDAGTVLLGALTVAQSDNDKAHGEITRLNAELVRARREIADLRASLKPSREGGHVLGAETVAALLDDFIDSVQNRLGTLRISSSDICLRAGFTALGDKTAAFVVPSAKPVAGEQLVLHDIRLRLDPKS